MRALALTLCLTIPQASTAQSISETMKRVVKSLPPAAFVAPEKATSFLIATLDPSFANAPALTSPVVTNASRLILPPGQTRRKVARTVGARFLLRGRTPSEIAALMLFQSGYGRGCTSLQEASRRLLGQEIESADARATLTLVTLTQAPSYYANTPERLAAAFDLNVAKLAENGTIDAQTAAGLLRLGPAPIPANAGCRD